MVSTWGRLRKTIRKNAYLGLVAAAGLVLFQAVDFEPPAQVRVDPSQGGNLVGDAPAQEFSGVLSNPQAVQLRATLRMYSDETLPVSSPDPEIDELGRVLSQPVVTTIYGVSAKVNQTIRLERGSLDVDMGLRVTPRVTGRLRPGKPPPPVTLEYELVVKGRRHAWMDAMTTERVHVDNRGFLSKVEEHGQRTVFSVDGHLFSLDLEINRPSILAGGDLARSNGG